MAETSTKVSGGVQGLDTEIHIITWDATDETLEVATALTKIHGYATAELYGANAGHTEEDLGFVEVDETVTSDGTIDVDADGEITVNRIAASADGTLAAQTSCLILYGTQT